MLKKNYNLIIVTLFFCFSLINYALADNNSKYQGVLGEKLIVEEVTGNSIYTGIWTRREGTDIFDAVWNGSIKDVIEIKSVEGNKIVLYRHGNKGQYYGTLSPDGTRISGTTSWYEAGWTWSATLAEETPAVDFVSMENSYALATCSYMSVFQECNNGDYWVSRWYPAGNGNFDCYFHKIENGIVVTRNHVTFYILDDGQPGGTISFVHAGAPQVVYKLYASANSQRTTSRSNSPVSGDVYLCGEHDSIFSIEFCGGIVIPEEEKR